MLKVGARVKLLESHRLKYPGGYYDDLKGVEGVVLAYASENTGLVVVKWDVPIKFAGEGPSREKPEYLVLSGQQGLELYGGKMTHV
jgi:hypothetical protein